MGKLAKRLEELRGVVEEPSKYDLAQDKLVESQKTFTSQQDKLVSDLKELTALVAELELKVDLSAIQESINNIKPVDLSGIEKSIKSIKPADLTHLVNKLDDLLTYVKMIKIPETDLSPIVSELNRPKTVEFRVISDNFGFPVKVIAEENGPTIN